MQKLKSKKTAKCAVLVSSCDKYEDAWNPFFILFAKYWPNCQYPIYLNTESKQYDFPAFEVKALNNTAISWSQRLKKALRMIDTKYIIFLLEDFFFLDNVNQKQINECMDVMNKDKSIAVINFDRCLPSSIDYKKCPKFCQRSLSQMYFLNCQASIWRRKDLISFLSPYEDAWQFEIYGSERAKLYNKKFLMLNKETPFPFVYNVNWITGYGLHKGKWLKSNVQLFKDNNIVVDFENLGFDVEKITITPPRVPKKVTLKERLLYLVFSGDDICPRLSITKQFLLLLSHPKRFLSLQKSKLIKCFSKQFY